MFNYHMPTRLFCGPKCLESGADTLSGVGKKALLVSGRGSARKNGSLAEMEALLQKCSMEWLDFSGVEPDPTLETVWQGALRGREHDADCVVGVGGGSAIDAAKAMAVLIANRRMTTEDLLAMPMTTSALPVVAVPTTAGTGTEVTPFFVLTNRNLKIKKAFRSLHTFPALSFVDARYTYALPEQVTIDTAVDAFSHLWEGFISVRANPVTDALSQNGFRLFQSCMDALCCRRFSTEVRDTLMLVSTLGGMVIATSGTASVHAMGYPLTVIKGIPHGRANGYLLAAQMHRCLEINAKTEQMLGLLQLESVDAWQSFWETLVEQKLELTPEEIKAFAQMSVHSKNHNNNPFNVDEQIIAAMFEESSGAK